MGEDVTRHDVVMATVHDFAERSGAARVAVLLDRGPERQAPLVECEPGGSITVTQGEEQVVVPGAALAGVEPLHVHAPKAVPATALEVRPETGEVHAPIGLVDALVEAVRELATTLGGRTVAVGDWATRSGDVLSIAARVGEPAVLAFGEHEFEVGPPNQGIPDPE
jgi:hypothetical protein